MRWCVWCVAVWCGAVRVRWTLYPASSSSFCISSQYNDNGYDYQNDRVFAPAKRECKWERVSKISYRGAPFTGALVCVRVLPLLLLLLLARPPARLPTRPLVCLGVHLECVRVCVWACTSPLLYYLDGARSPSSSCVPIGTHWRPEVVRQTGTRTNARSACAHTDIHTHAHTRINIYMRVCVFIRYVHACTHMSTADTRTRAHQQAAHTSLKRIIAYSVVGFGPSPLHPNYYL